MRWTERKISFVIIVFLFVGGILFGMFKESRKEYYTFPQLPKTINAETSDLSEKAIVVDEPIKSTITGRTNYRERKMVVDGDFTTNLPLVVIDTNGKEPRRSVVWDSEKGYYVPIDEDAYAYGTISIIDNKNKTNSINEQATLKSNMKIKVRGNSSGNYDKQQYLFKLLNEKGKSSSENILGMGSDSEWILNVSFIDKSLLRNYLAYTTVGQVMPFVPDARFCEVVWKDGDNYYYEGVYMMLETIKKSEHRVDIPKYSENSQYVSALIRRDRFNLNGIMMDNYATNKGLTPGYLDIEYPYKEDITEVGIKKITKTVDNFERALYSEDWEDFVKYRDTINMESFVDYFIFNEFFLNYDAGYNSTYMYIDYDGKINMGPIWDFDQAMDNNAEVTAILNTTAFHAAPWFDRMLQDPIFVEYIINRYHQLRESILSEESITDFVNSTINYLGPSIDRDWARWGYYYIDGHYLTNDIPGAPERNTITHEAEVEKILSVIFEHGKWMDEHLDSLYQFKKISLEEAQAELIKEEPNDSQPTLAVIFVLIFLVSIKLVIEYNNE